MRGLTNRQRQVLDFVRLYLRKHRYPPSRAEIAEGLGMPHASAVDGHLIGLERKGWISTRPDIPRTIRLLRDDVPVVPAGEVAAGEPILAEGRVVERIPGIVAERFRPKPDYFLKVRGDSMDQLVRDGDLVAVKAAQEGPKEHHRKVVVARLGDEVTLKRLVLLDDRTVELRPESANPEHRVRRIDLSEEELGIDGQMVGGLIGAP